MTDIIQQDGAQWHSSCEKQLILAYESENILNLQLPYHHAKVDGIKETSSSEVFIQF